jgi:hypothetical protein
VKSTPKPKRLVETSEFHNVLKKAQSEQPSDEQLALLESAIKNKLAKPRGQTQKTFARRLGTVTASLILLFSMGATAYIYMHELAHFMEKMTGTTKTPEVHPAPGPTPQPVPKPVPRPTQKTPEEPLPDNLIEPVAPVVTISKQKKPAPRQIAEPVAEPVSPEKTSTLSEQLRIFGSAEQWIKKKQYLKAISELDQLDRQYPMGLLMVDSLEARAEVLYLLKRNQEAIAVCQKLLSLPNLAVKKAQVFLLLGDLFRREGDCEKAQINFRRALKMGLDPNKAQTAQNGIEDCKNKAK